MSTKRLLLPLVTALPLGLIGAPALADEYLWIYTRGADTLPAGAVEAKFSDLVRDGKDSGDYRFHDLRFELEYGITSRLTVSAEVLVFHHDYSVDDPDLNPMFETQGGEGGRFKDTQYAGFELGAKYNVLSTYKDNAYREWQGTSFAAPLVSRTLAQIYHQITPIPSPVLARALLTHHARDPRSGQRVPDGEENFFGFGLPAAVPYCLECTPHTATLVFDDVLRPGYFLEWDDFPYPPSLRRDDKYFGEVWMTLAFAPARGARWGTEYCETHINAHLGVYRDRVSRETGEVKQVFTGLVPPEHRNPGMLYETYQVEKLRKWAPVRTYHGRLSDKGERGNRWRLKLQLLTRHGVEDETTFKPQPFSLIITIADPAKKAPVYDEMAQIVRNRFQAQNLAVRPRARVRGSIQ